MSMRFMRSPLAPKKITLHGSWMRLESIPARSGFGRAFGAGKPGRIKVAAEEVSDTGGLRFDCASAAIADGGGESIAVAAAQERSRQVRALAPKSDHPELHE